MKTKLTNNIALKNLKWKAGKYPARNFSKQF
jgi:hypothetical protein